MLLADLISSKGPDAKICVAFGLLQAAIEKLACDNAVAGQKSVGLMTMIRRRHDE